MAQDMASGSMALLIMLKSLVTTPWQELQKALAIRSVLAILPGQKAAALLLAIAQPTHPTVDLPLTLALTRSKTMRPSATLFGTVLWILAIPPTTFLIAV